MEEKTRKWAEDKMNAGANNHKMYGKRDGYNLAVQENNAKLRSIMGETLQE